MSKDQYNITYKRKIAKNAQLITNKTWTNECM